jgi:hypothetical protein
MIKRGLTLVNAMHITASVFINDDAGPRAGCTTAPARPVPRESRGQRQCAPEAGSTNQLHFGSTNQLHFGSTNRLHAGSTNRLHFAGHGPRRAAVVAVTNARLDGSTEGFDRGLRPSSAEGLTPRASPKSLARGSGFSTGNLTAGGGSGCWSRLSGKGGLAPLPR